jgi:2-succinyl-5-enolpyruvyl-6-hydroxy-3-cyclohexene-1-carboxylate synthase
MGNSSVVRYCQLYDPDPSISYYSNRGVSGIDGSTSTAAGFAVAQPGQMNILISGDVSFFYDSNGLWNSYLRNNFRVIVINNGGGGIFQILEGSNSVKQAPLFFSPYEASIKLLSEAYGCKHLLAETEEELVKILPAFYNSPGTVKPVILEVKTFSCSNAGALKDYFAYLGGRK